MPSPTLSHFILRVTLRNQFFPCLLLGNQVKKLSTSSLAGLQTQAFNFSPYLHTHSIQRETFSGEHDAGLVSLIFNWSTTDLQYFRYTAKWCDIFMYYTKVISILLTVLPVLYIILSVWGENVHELFWAVSAGDPGLLLLWYPWGPFTESYCIPWKKTWI